MLKVPCTLTFSRKDGSDPKTFLFQACVPEDVPDILALQDAVYEGLPDKNTFVRLTEEEVRESIEKDACLSVFCGDILAAYTLVVANRVSPQNLGSYLGYSEEEMKECVTYDTTFVHPDFRGYGLQKQFIAWKDEEGRRMGAKWALCTVSPDNPNSLNNTLRAGFEIVEEKEMYGGIRRYVLRKALV